MNIVFYHSKCFDGSMAAAAAYHAVQTGILPKDTVFSPISYQDDIFQDGILDKLNPDDRTADIYFLDFCPKPEVLRMLSDCGDTVTVLDHHESAQAYVPKVAGLDNLNMIFDMGRSGARMAWDYFIEKGMRYRGRSVVPRLASHVEDRDLWKFLLPGTREAIAWLSVSAELNNPASYFLALDDFEENSKEKIEIGRFIRKEMAVQVSTMASKWRTVDLEGYPTGAMVCAPCYASEVAEEVYENANVPYVMVYSITKDGRVALSFRSKQGAAHSIRVNDLAARFEGGGHPNAAGGVTSLEVLNELLLSSNSQKSLGGETDPKTCGC